jgi:pimeloyl-ACP methyl ester carboxylesterase
VTTFCLLHSSGQGPEGFRLVRDELERRGDRVITPFFDIARTDQGAAYHAKTVVEALDASGSKPAETVCVAHSASGMYVPIVAQRWRPRLMVFLAAIIPRPGQSVKQLLSTDPTMFNPAWIGQDPNDDRAAVEFVFHDCPPDRLAWALSTRIFFYARTAIEESCPLEAWPSVPAAYIACEDDRTITPRWQVRRARDWLGVDAVRLPGGHCPNVSRPIALADALQRVAA